MSIGTLTHSIAKTSFQLALQAGASIGSTILKNPRITTLATATLALLSLPIASGGPISGIACYVSCVASATGATGGALLPAAVLACTELCAAITLAPFLP